MPYSIATQTDADAPVHSIPWDAVVLRKSVGRKSTSHLKAGHYIPVDDEDVLRQLINFRFSRATLTSTRYATNTQKSEATHRGYSKSKERYLCQEFPVADLFCNPPHKPRTREISCHECCSWSPNHWRYTSMPSTTKETKETSAGPIKEKVVQVPGQETNSGEAEVPNVLSEGRERDPSRLPEVNE